MRWIFFLIPGLLLASRAVAQENEAEKLFRALEKKVRAAKSLEVVFEGSGTGGDIKAKFKGKLLVGDGNRFRIETEAAVDGKKNHSLLASDGKLVYSKGVSSATWLAHAENTARVRAYFARGGFSATGDCLDPESGVADLDKALAPADFKLGAKEKIGGKDAQVVECMLTVAKKGGASETRKMALWIDPKTQLPLQRRLEFKEGNPGVTVTLVETYPTFTLDAKIDAKAFALPKSD
jgi:outer membrane lipoprotein-sorting protein